MVNNINNSTPLFSQNVDLGNYTSITAENMNSYKIGNQGQLLQRGSIRQAFRNFADMFVSDQSIKERNANVAMGIVKLRQNYLAQLTDTAAKSDQKTLLSYSMTTCKNLINQRMHNDMNTSGSDSYVLNQYMEKLMDRMPKTNLEDFNSTHDIYSELTEINKVISMDNSVSKHMACAKFALKGLQNANKEETISFASSICSVVDELKKKIDRNIINKGNGEHSHAIAQAFLSQVNKDILNSGKPEDVNKHTESALSLVSNMLRSYDDGLNSIVKSGIDLLKANTNDNPKLQDALTTAFKEKISRSTNMTSDEKKSKYELLEKELNLVKEETQSLTDLARHGRVASASDPDLLSNFNLSQVVARKIEDLDRIIFNN